MARQSLEEWVTKKIQDGIEGIPQVKTVPSSTAVSVRITDYTTINHFQASASFELILKQKTKKQAAGLTEDLIDFLSTLQEHNFINSVEVQAQVASSESLPTEWTYTLVFTILHRSGIDWATVE